MKNFLIEEAGGKRICNECKETIKKNEKCLAFRYGRGMYSVSRNLCKKCINEISKNL